MSETVLRIHPIIKNTSPNDILKALGKIKVIDLKIKNQQAFVTFLSENTEIQNLLNQQFPLRKCLVAGKEVQLTLLKPHQISSSHDKIQSEIQKHGQQNQSKQPKLLAQRSLQGNNPKETKLLGKIQDPSALQLCLKNNVKWAEQMIKNQPDYFKKLINIQKPKYLWIGCADSRVPANQIVGLKPGQLFVHRNVANIVSPSDINVLAVIQYAVESLEVQDIIVTGHYGCGGVKASFSKTDYGLLQAWLSNLRQIRARYNDILDEISIQNDRVNKLVQLNVQSQVLNLSRIPIIQKAWKNSKKLRIHGLVYRLEDGILHDLKVSMDSLDHIPTQYRIIE